jgi:hypothetical protein
MRLSDEHSLWRAYLYHGGAELHHNPLRSSWLKRVDTYEPSVSRVTVSGKSAGSRTEHLDIAQLVHLQAGFQMCQSHNERRDQGRLTLRTIVLAGCSSAGVRGERSTGHSAWNERALVIQSLQKVCVHEVVAVGIVKGMLSRSSSGPQSSQVPSKLAGKCNRSVTS